MIRPGHHRPIGSTTAPWRFSWSTLRPPQLGDIALESGAGGAGAVQRAFLCIGIEETTSKRRPYRLTFERLAWDDAYIRLYESGAAHVWAFLKDES